MYLGWLFLSSLCGPKTAAGSKGRGQGKTIRYNGKSFDFAGIKQEASARGFPKSGAAEAIVRKLQIDDKIKTSIDAGNQVLQVMLDDEGTEDDPWAGLRGLPSHLVG